MRNRNLLFLCFLFFAVSAPMHFAFANTGQSVVFVASPVQNGASEGLVLLPRVVTVGGSSLADRVRGLFDALEGEVQGRYQGIEIELASSFEISRSVELTCSRPNPAECEVALAEIGMTFKLAGVQQIVWKSTGLKAEITSLPAPGFVPVVPFWAALPPNKISLGLVQVGERYMAADDFYVALKNRNIAVSRAARSVLESGSITARLSVANNAEMLGVKKNRYMLPLLDHPHASVRIAGLKMLVKYKNDEFFRKCKILVKRDDNAEVKLLAARTLVKAGLKKYEVYLLMDDLRASDVNKVRSALKQLVATGNLLLSPALVPLLKHSDTTVREEAAKGLVSLKAYDAMMGALNEGDLQGDLKILMSKSLATDGSGAGRDKALSILLTSTEPTEIVFGLKAIEANRVAGHEAAVVDLIKKKVEETWLPAVKVAVALKLEAAVEPLAAITDDATLGKQANEQLELLLAATGARRIAVFAEHQDPRIRAAAMRALGRLGTSASGRSGQILLSRLSDSDVRIRRSAVNALSRVVTRRVADKLAALIADGDEEIRAMVLGALVKVKHAKAEELSVKGLSDQSDKVKEVAANGIRALKIRKALPELWKRLRYGTPELRRAVLAGIVELSTIEERKKQLSALAELFYVTDVPIRLLAIDAVRGFRDPLVYSNLGMLVDVESLELRVKTLHALGETKDPRVIEYVVNGLLADEKECKLAALSALRNINSLKAEKALQEYITNEADVELRGKAEEVLDGLSG